MAFKKLLPNNEIVLWMFVFSTIISSIIVNIHIYAKRASRKQNNIRHLYFKVCEYIRPVVIVRLLQNFYILSFTLIHRDRVKSKFIFGSHNISFGYPHR